MGAGGHEPWTVLYDGRCGMCRAGARRFGRVARPGSVNLVDMRAPGVLERFPNLDPSACERAMHVVSADGREVRVGAAAVVAAIETRPAFRLITWTYRVPGLRQGLDWLYARIANNRMTISRVLGFRVEACEDGACSTHEPRSN